MTSYRLGKSYVYENYDDDVRGDRKIRFKKNNSHGTLSSITSDSTSISSYKNGSRKINSSKVSEYVPNSNCFIKNLSDASSLTSDRSIHYTNNYNSHYNNSIDDFNPNGEYTSRCICYDKCDVEGYKSQIDPRQYGIKTPLKDSHFIKRVLPYKYHYILYKSKFLPKVPCLACAASEYENLNFNSRIDEESNDYPHLSLGDVSIEDIQNGALYLDERPFEGGTNSYSNPDRKETLFSRIGSSIKESASNAASSIKKSIVGDELAISDKSVSRSQSKLSALTGPNTSLRALSRASRGTSISPNRLKSEIANKSNNELAMNASRRSSKSRLASIGSGIKELVHRMSTKSLSRNSSVNAIENSKSLARTKSSSSKAPSRVVSRAASIAASRAASLKDAAKRASIGASKTAPIEGSKAPSIAPSRMSSLPPSDFQPKSVLKPSLPLPDPDRRKSRLNLDNKSPLYIENGVGLEAINDGERQSSIFSLNASIPGVTPTSIEVLNATGTSLVSSGSKSTELKTNADGSLSKKSISRSNTINGVATLEDSSKLVDVLPATSTNAVSDSKLKELSDKKSHSSKSKGEMVLASPNSSNSGTHSIKSLHTDSEAPDTGKGKSIVKFENSKGGLNAISNEEKFSLENDISYKAIENYTPDASKSHSPSIFAFKEILDKPIPNAIENKSLGPFSSIPAEISPKSTHSTLNRTLPPKLPSFKGKPLGSIKPDLKSSPLTSPRPEERKRSSEKSILKSRSNSSRKDSLKGDQKSSSKSITKKVSIVSDKDEPKVKKQSISKLNTINVPKKRDAPDVGAAYCSSITPNCHYMAVGTDLGYVLIWDFVGHNTNSKFTYDYWEEAAEAPTAGVMAHTGKVLSIDTKTVPLVTGTSECMVITLGEDLSVKMWILINNRIRLLTVDEFDLNKPVSVLFGKGLSMVNDVMIGYQDGFIELWNSSALSCLETLVPSGLPLSTKPKPNDKSTSFRTKIKRSTHTYMNLTCLSLSPTGSYFAIGGDTGMVSLYSLDREINLLNQFPCRNRRGKYSDGTPVSGIEWSDDGSNLCVTTCDNRIRTFFVRKGLGLEFAEKFKGFTLTHDKEYARFAGTNNDLLICLSKDLFGFIKIVVWSRTVTDVMDLPTDRSRKYPTNSRCKQFLLDYDNEIPRFELCQMGRWGHLEETVGEIIPVSRVSGNVCLKLRTYMDRAINGPVQGEEVNDHTNNLLCVLSTGPDSLRSIVISPINLMH